MHILLYYWKPFQDEGTAVLKFVKYTINSLLLSSGNWISRTITNLEEITNLFYCGQCVSIRPLIAGIAVHT